MASFFGKKNSNKYEVDDELEAAGTGVAVGSDEVEYWDQEDRIAKLALDIGLDIDNSEDEALIWIAEVGLLSPLPPRWESIPTEDGNMYYHNRDTNESTWNHPFETYLKYLVQVAKHLMAYGGNVQEYIQAIRAQLKEDLDWWHGPFDCGGYPYYINSRNNVSSWEDPRVDAQYLFELQCGILLKVEESGMIAPAVVEGIDEDSPPTFSEEAMAELERAKNAKKDVELEELSALEKQLKDMDDIEKKHREAEIKRKNEDEKKKLMEEMAMNLMQEQEMENEKMSMMEQMQEQLQRERAEVEKLRQQQADVEARAAQIADEKLQKERENIELLAQQLAEKKIQELQSPNLKPKTESSWQEQFANHEHELEEEEKLQAQTDEKAEGLVNSLFDVFADKPRKDPSLDRKQSGELTEKELKAMKDAEEMREKMEAMAKRLAELEAAETEKTRTGDKTPPTGDVKNFSFLSPKAHEGERTPKKIAITKLDQKTIDQLKEQLRNKLAEGADGGGDMRKERESQYLKMKRKIQIRQSNKRKKEQQEAAAKTAAKMPLPPPTAAQAAANTNWTNEKVHQANVPIEKGKRKPLPPPGAPPPSEPPRGQKSRSALVAQLSGKK